VIQSPGDILPESEIYFLLAKRLNLNISFELIPEPGNINIEKWLEKRISGYSELTLKDLKKAPVLAPGLQQIAWEDLKFETQSGKIERQLSGQKADIGYSWFPNKNLDPAIEFTAGENNDPLRIIPENIYKSEITKPVNKEKSISGELSLIVFSFLTTLSVATLISSIFRGVYPERTVFIPVIVLAGLASFFHLGKRLRSWRSVSNLKNSPLSREIAFYLIYSTLSSITVFFQLPVFLIISSVIGLVLLILIDSVYIYADKRKYVKLHSGQTFLSALLIVSFLSGAVFPFIFIAIIKLVASLYSLLVKKMNSNFEIRFLRIAFLIVTGFSLISHNSYSDLITISIFLTGEFFDRIIFYIDFNPLNINALINSQLNIDRDEKKRGK